MGTISIQDFSKRFGEAPLFSGFSLEAEPGDIIGIQGPTGTGKTTLLRCIAGLEDYEGTIEVGGDLGYLFQDPRIAPWMDVRKNILLPLYLQDRDVTDAHIDRMEYLADRLGVGEHLDKQVHEISGGQKQRILQVRALLHEPDILLLDEPFKSLDAQTRSRVYDEVLGLCREEGRTVLIASHQPDIDDHVDRAIDLRQHPAVSGER